LYQGLQLALSPFAQTYQERRQGAAWLRDIAYILEPSTVQPPTAAHIAEQLRSSLDTVRRLPDVTPTLYAFGLHLDKVSRSYWPGLFHCYDVLACRGPTTNSKATSVIPVAAYCGPRANKASPSAHCNAKARGNSSRAPRQRASYWGPCATLSLRTWCRNDSALLRIANDSACSVALSNKPEGNSRNYVRGGRHYRLQAQGDFRGIARDRRVIRDLCQNVSRRIRQGRRA
jgi:hypothetical protein